MTIQKIAVKEIAYFVCGSGDLTPEFFLNHDVTQGNMAHDYLQAKYNSKSKKEVYIKHDFNINNKEYEVHGFIDGVLNIKDEIIIEEIKSTSVDLNEIALDYHKEHLAQLKIYAYLYALNNNLDYIKTRLTYISIIDYETKSYDTIFKLNDLEDFTIKVLEEYISWLDLLKEVNKNKTETIKSIKFPFISERPGQRDLMKACYNTMVNNDILYAIAPTGIGKTMATLFSSLKALKTQDKLFYLTAKGSGKNAPLDAIKILSNKGLKIKTIDITAKRKICNKQSKHCNPDECEFAIGFFDRLKVATKEIFMYEDTFDSKIITEVANNYKLCAFEFSLYLSYFCDVVIADYNYIFDPKAQLVRYVDDDTYKVKVLVDEAHNLISRSKEMYSASISNVDIRVLRKLLTDFTPSIRNDCNKAIQKIEKYVELLSEKALYCDIRQDHDLEIILKNIVLKCDQIFDSYKKINKKDEILEIYFKILDFLRTSEYFSSNHRLLAKINNDIITIEYLCLDASIFLLDTIKTSVRGIVFFSATLYPIDYHMNLLTHQEGKYLEISSPFDPDKLDIIINNQISTKFKNRSDSIDSIIESIEILTEAHEGNYIVFFPSYQYLKMIVDKINNPNYEMIIQENGISEEEKNEIIEKFKTTTNNKVGFFVMGGVFSEGIDFVGNSLSGVIIVGVGLPLYCDENNILKDYFEMQYHKGFDYAYTYPGFTKVIQAVGRVIRTYSDYGIVILMDERFTYKQYEALMPPHWSNKKVITNSYLLKKEIIDFYKNN